MGLLSSFFESRSLENPSTPLSSADSWLYDALGAMKASSGVSVNRETALSIPAIWRGVNLISRDTGKLPCHIQRRANGGWENDTKHPGYSLLRHKPNDAMTAITFRQTLQGHAILEGNGYAYIARNGAGEPIELIPLAPRQVVPVRVNGVLWYVYHFIDGQQRKIPYTDIIHVKGFSYDGFIGYNFVHKARETLGLAMAQQTYSSVYFRNNARPSIVLQAPNAMKPEAMKNLAASWERLYSGIENAHRTAVLEQGIKAEVLSGSAAESQLIEQMKYGLVDVSNLLGVPPHKVGAEGGRSYASLEQENQAYLDEGLDPWLVTHEEEYRDKLLTEEEKESDSHRVRFNRKELLRANLGARGAFYVQMLQWGVYCPDDVRAEEGENPQPNDIGKKYYRPLNMGTVGADGKIEVPSQPTAPPGAGSAPSGDKPPLALPKPDGTSDTTPPDDGPQRAAQLAAQAAQVAQRAAMVDAVSAMVHDAVRRMVTRLGSQGERAASDRKKFGLWLNRMDLDTVQDAMGPSELALGALELPGGLASWLGERVRDEFLEMSGRCTPAKLAGEAAILTGRLVESLPIEAVEKFCGGLGSGVPGPCPKEGDKVVVPPAVKDTLGNIDSKAKDNEAEAIKNAVGDDKKAGQELKDKLVKVLNEAEITVNFETKNAGAAIADSGKLINAFQSGSGRDPGYVKTRDAQEKNVMGCKDVALEDRPIYAAVNFQSDLFGGARQYGGACIVLNKDELKGRTTLAPRNTFGMRDGSTLGTLENPVNALGRNPIALAAAGHSGETKDPIANKDSYTEAHIWGGMALTKDTVKEIRIPATHAGTDGAAKMVAFGEKTGIPVKFIHDNTGQQVEYKVAKGWADDAAKKSSWIGKIKSMFGG